MAKEYIKEILTIQPDGPYYLTGVSMGGLIAYEIAIQLKNKDKNIAFIALFDSFTPMFYKNRIDRFKLRHSHKLAKLSLIKVLGYFLKKIPNKIENIYKMMVCKLYKLNKLAIPYNFRHWYVRQKNRKTIYKYSPGIYKGNVFLFSDSKTKISGNNNLKKGWEKYITGNIEVVEIPAEHNNFLEHPLLAKELSKHLIIKQGEQVHNK